MSGKNKKTKNKQTNKQTNNNNNNQTEILLFLKFFPSNNLCKTF